MELVAARARHRGSFRFCRAGDRLVDLRTCARARRRGPRWLGIRVLARPARALVFACDAAARLEPDLAQRTPSETQQQRRDRRRMCVMHVPAAADLAPILESLAAWQRDDGPFQLHPGDLGWHWRFGAEQTA